MKENDRALRWKELPLGTKVIILTGVVLSMLACVGPVVGGEGTDGPKTTGVPRAPEIVPTQDTHNDIKPVKAEQPHVTPIPIAPR